MTTTTTRAARARAAIRATIEFLAQDNRCDRYLATHRHNGPPVRCTGCVWGLAESAMRLRDARAARAARTARAGVA